MKLIICAVFCIATGFACSTFGEFQLQDRLTYNGKMWDISAHPLEEYGPIRTGILSLWWQPDTFFQGNLRGYVASWKIEENRLWLMDIKGAQGLFLGEYQPASLSSLFPDQTGAKRIWAQWFSGDIFYPAHRYGPHLLPLTKEKQMAQATWAITVVSGMVTEVETGIQNTVPAPSARFTVGARHYSSMPSDYELLARPEVGTELALAPDQIAALEQAERDSKGKMPRWRDKEMGKPSETVSALLNKKQNARLQELIIQMNGPSILLAPLVKPPPALAVNDKQKRKIIQAHNNVYGKYSSLLSGYFYGHTETLEELDVLADALQDILHEADDAVLEVLTPEQQAEFAQMCGAPLPIRWPKHSARRQRHRKSGALGNAEIYRGVSFTPPERPQGIEFINCDTLRLTRENMLFRRISPRRYGESGRDFFLMETEVPNDVYALYLKDTKNQKGDWDLYKKLLEREKENSSSWSSIDTPYHLQNPALLWSNNIPPKGNEKLPVALVMHSDAMAFCAWLNKRYPELGYFWLPNRHQWCLAAYGGDSRSYPWGDKLDLTIPHISPSRSSQMKAPLAIDLETRDVTPEGIQHLGGNVQEYLAATAPGENLMAMDTSWAGNSFNDSPEDACTPLKPRQDYWGYHHGNRSRQEDMGFRVILIPKGSYAEF